MTTSTPHRHTKKRLMKTVGAHTLCSCGYMQNGGLYFYININNAQRSVTR